MRPTAIFLACTVSILVGSAARADAPKLDPSQIEFFEKQVRPVLVAECFKCHGPEKQKGGLRVDSQAMMLAGGDSGPAMKPGNPDQSRIIAAIRHADGMKMPPSKKLPDEQIAALTAWVKMGAPWPPSSGEVRPVEAVKGLQITSKDRAFWSFVPVKEPSLPAVKNTSWAKAPLDQFVLAQLEAKGLSPVGPADKRTLIRRASFDLIGLPPTVEETKAFVQDESPNAFAKVVDRLLASPHYGERWARHWLDVARYGEDQAHSFQARLYPYGYRYRDWVIQALNNDFPYDRFIKEQIAADLIDSSNQPERLAALGYFALGPVYYGGAVLDELDDRVDTLCRGFLGLTVACARCHDHKFDPIPTKDYYSLAGIFSSTKYKEYPITTPAEAAEIERAQAKVNAQTDEIAKFIQTESAKVSEALVPETTKYMVAVWKLQNKRKSNAKLTVAEFAKQEKLNEITIDRWMNYLAKTDERPFLANWRKVLAELAADQDLSQDEEAVVAVRQAAEEFQQTLETILKERSPELAKDKAALLDEIVSPQGVFGFPKNQAEKQLPGPAQKQLAALRAELEKSKKAMPKVPVVHSLTEGQPTNMRVHVRGNPATLADEAPRHFLSILCNDSPALFKQGSGRLELAQAIASKDNPLTARVMVNRLWLHHFGKGIVGTPSNFGSLGERPTNPQLLDYLASRFMANGWSLKAMHREIMLSATYQLASTYEASNYQSDPENKLFWRADRRRLEVEPWRDALLAVSGQINLTVGGPSFDLSAQDNGRRTLYASVSRHNLDLLLRLFDFPDPNITSARRPITTVALQQLFVLNSEFMVRQSKLLAAKLTANAQEDDAARIRRAFAIVYSRPPSEAEVQLGLEFLSTAQPGKKRGTLSVWEQYAQVLLGANEFAFVD